MPVLSENQRTAINSLIESNSRAQVWMALGMAARSDQINLNAARVAAKVLIDKTAATEHKREALRLLQLSLGDVGPQSGVPGMFESYLPRSDLSRFEVKLNPVRTLLASELSSGNSEYDRELMRTIGMLGSTDRNLSLIHI